MYRPEIKVIDCTIRDGGLMNNSKFSKKLVKKVFQAVQAAGVDIVELGYRNSRKLFDPKEYGIWRFSDDDLLIDTIGDVKNDTIRLAVMMDAHKSFIEDINPKSESLVDVIRIATYVKDVDKAIALANCATKNGYEAFINIMAVSHVLERELDEALKQIEEETDITACVIVDSFGALYSEDIHYLVHKFKKYIQKKEVGIHCHNHQQLAFANTIEGIIKGVNYVDGTLYGLGRAAGNCPLELLISFLKNPKFDVRPLLEVIGSDILPLQKTIDWGYRIPYMVAGTLNIHPLEAMKLLALPDDDPKKTDFKKFYEVMSSGDLEEF